MNILGINLSEEIKESLLENLDGDFSFENHYSSLDSYIDKTIFKNCIT